MSATWGSVIQDELVSRQARSLSGKGPRAPVVVLKEVHWDPEVRAFSGLMVTVWTLLNLPRMVGTQTAMNVESIENQGPHASWGATIWARIGNMALRGLVFPSLITLVVLTLWIVNPPVVLVSGIMSFVASLWNGKRFGWRPFRLANLVMSRIVGDAFIWLVSPAGRAFSKGSQRAPITLFREKASDLRRRCDVVVAVAHSQGAAVAVKALSEDPGLCDHLITVGGGHRLLAALESARPERVALRVISVLVQLAICIPIFYFLYLYVIELLLIFVAPPFAALEPLLVALQNPHPTASIWPTYVEAIGVMIPRLLDWGIVVIFGVTSLSTTFVLLAMFRLTRPMVPDINVGAVRWTEVWSRFDPVCSGPRADRPDRMRDAASKSYKSTPGVNHRIVETWSLIGKNPLLEHVSYFRRGTTALAVIAAEIGAHIGKRPVSIELPANDATFKIGQIWRRAGFWLAPVVLVLAFWTTRSTR